MAFFKSRSAAKDTAKPRQSDSIEAMRKRARHRLIGATVLVLIGVIGFPLLFDTQPRPIAVDIPIDIPDRNHVKPLPLPADVMPAPVASGRVTSPLAAASAAAPHASVAAVAPPAASAAVQSPALAKAEPRADAKPEPRPESKPEPGPAAKPQGTARTESKPEVESAAKPQATAKAAAADDGSRAKALLEGGAPAPAAAQGRFVVQVGAFADPAKARETRLRVERAGLKTYTHVAETRNGRRIRVRVGPFPTRSEADQAASKIKRLDLPAAILIL